MTFLTFVVFALMIFTFVLLILMALFMTTAVERNTVGVTKVLIRGANITPVARL